MLLSGSWPALRAGQAGSTSAPRKKLTLHGLWGEAPGLGTPAPAPSEPRQHVPAGSLVLESLTVSIVPRVPRIEGCWYGSLLRTFNPSTGPVRCLT